MATPRNLTVTSDHLAAVLEGRAYLLCDGGMGTLVQAAGLHTVHEVPDLLNLTHPQDIAAIQRRYVEAGADCITTNTFSANRLKLKDTDATVAQVYAAAAAIAREAGAPLVAGDIGPTGALLEPLGPLTLDEAYDIFAEQACAAEAAGCDVVLIETMADLLEAKAAVLAAVENTSLPVFATMTFGEDGRTFLGTTPAIAATTLSALGAQAVGLNCSLGPVELAPLVDQLAPAARSLVMAQPNAGLPRLQDGETVFDVGPKEFAQAMEAILDAGATVVGGCCGTTPEHIRALRAVLDGRPAPGPIVEAAAPISTAPSSTPASKLPVPNPRYEAAFAVASAQRMVRLPQGQAAVAVIGERINPTGKKKLKAALQAGDVDYLVAEAAAQQRARADILDVNVGVPGLDEPALLTQVVCTLQATVPLPLQLDSSDPAAIEAAARIYAGRPLVNSVNGKAANLAAVLPVVARYGCTVVGLTLDENGIPPTAEERLAIARRIVEAAADYGIPREDVAIDCLVMAAATNQAEVREILRAVTLVKQELGVRTVLGVSNVSFGLPQRPLVNATFLAAAFGAGLDMPILNPLNARYRDTVDTFRVLNGQDEGCRYFLDTYAGVADPYDGPASGTAEASAAAAPGESAGAPSAAGGATGTASSRQGGAGAPSAATCPIPVTPTFADVPESVAALAAYALEGRGAPLAEATAQLLETHDGLAIINDIFVPVLDVVGLKYDDGTFFLPQLMASAEAVKAGFDVIRAQQEAAGAAGRDSATADPTSAAHDAATTSPDHAAPSPSSRAIVVATVEGDIHDIGKNIVKMLLENYGFPVIDLGRDVAPQAIVDAAREAGARLIGLSALMTTTVGAMEHTIQLVHQQLPQAAVMVGGAVITQEFADQIGADFYAKDAAESTRVATQFFGEEA
ncbi:homocysteine S-methyltransferase family protein [Adlercreutzia equolifaciens]|uniref:homocysteine S-methyltransferase family protein n=1 Tax=Adlercreutzia equolifaciens TaxID=446660 RepID=UPI0023B10F89|nr:homocysteine S-methyltransferase family protein [Adlercreutzia equolifaciens]MDE8701446.1 homocysteine S-methyltransferase family protein [Adlercreutzia equolifaciens]